MNLRYFLLLLLLAFFTADGGAKEAAPLAEDPQIEARLGVLAQDLRCLVCQNQSLADSHAPLAEDLRREIREQMKQGKSDAEVTRFLVERYGDFVLYNPPLKTSTLLLWGGPFALLLIGLAALVAVLRRRAGQADEVPDIKAREAARKLLQDGD